MNKNRQVVVNVYNKYFLFNSVNECARFLNKDYHTISRWIKTKDSSLFGISYREYYPKDIVFADKNELLKR